MQQSIGIAVADRLPVMGTVDAAQPQRAARPQAMSVVSDAYTLSVRGEVSFRLASLVGQASSLTTNRSGWKPDLHVNCGGLYPGRRGKERENLVPRQTVTDGFGVMPTLAGR